MLGLVVPAAAVIYLRRKMPESPRYQVQVQGNAAQAASQMSDFTGGQVSGTGTVPAAAGPAAAWHRMGLREFLTDRRLPGVADRHGGNLVPARLRLLREHNLHPRSILRPDLAPATPRP